MPYNTAAIRELLSAAFDDQELTTLCFDHFHAVYEKFTWGMSRLDKLQLLIDYCKRHGQFEQLLTKIQKLNPNQYEKFAASIRETVDVSNVKDEARGPIPITPTTPASTLASPTIDIYIRNRDLSIQRYMRVSPEISGWQLFAQLYSTLELKDSVSVAGGLVGLRFKYALLYKDQPVPEQLSLAQIGIKDGSLLDLQVTVEQFTPTKRVMTVDFRPDKESDALTPEIKRRLLIKAFNHLFSSEEDSQKKRPG